LVIKKGIFDLEDAFWREQNNFKGK